GGGLRGARRPGQQVRLQRTLDGGDVDDRRLGVARHATDPAHLHVLGRVAADGGGAVRAGPVRAVAGVEDAGGRHRVVAVTGDGLVVADHVGDDVDVAL